ncbi:MAG: hypothetical protein ACMXX7_00780 [Candidatus Woesearchaeota archaeon]
MNYITLTKIKRSRSLGKIFLELQRQLIEHTKQELTDKLIDDYDNTSVKFNHQHMDIFIQLDNNRLDYNNILLQRHQESLFIMPQEIRNNIVYGLRDVPSVILAPIIKIKDEYKPIENLSDTKGLLRIIGEGIRQKMGHYEVKSNHYKHIYNLN